MADHIDHLKSLHTTVVDARNGYDEALADAEGKGLTPLFREMADLHGGHAGELASELLKSGEEPNNDGSFLSTIHRTVISIRSLFGGLDETILPGLIDGEERVLSYYDEAMADASPADRQTIARQRSVLAAKVQEMKALRDRAAG